MGNEGVRKEKGDREDQREKGGLEEGRLLRSTMGHPEQKQAGSWPLGRLLALVLTSMEAAAWRWVEWPATDLTSPYWC